MVKRKAGRHTAKEDGEDVKMRGTGDSEDDESDEGPTTVDVTFEMFDPQPTHDFHGLRTLLRQLFDVDSTLFDLSSLTDLILSQPLLGTTVKVDGNESDPFAFLTVLNLREHRAHPAVRQLVSYLLTKSRGDSSVHATLRRYLSDSYECDTEAGKEGDANPTSNPTPNPGALGLILSERLLNIPTEVVPPMYRMLFEEIQWANEEGEPYDFSAYVILSKTYAEVPSEFDAEGAAGADDDAARRPKRKKFKSRLKQAGAAPAAQDPNTKQKYSPKDLFYFHPEDELLHQKATAYMNYKYTKEQESGAADSKRTFSDYGIIPQGHMIVIEHPALCGMVDVLSNTYKY